MRIATNTAGEMCREIHRPAFFAGLQDLLLSRLSPASAERFPQGELLLSTSRIRVTICTA
jgi:hypothetical protein